MQESQLYIERQVENVDDYLDYVQYQVSTLVDAGIITVKYFCLV